MKNEFIPQLKIISSNEEQEISGTWFRGEVCNFYPTKKEFSSENFHNNYLLKGYKLDNRHLKDEYVNKIMELFEKNFCITT